MKKVILLVVWVIWTLLCIYGTYDNTVKSAKVAVIEDGYTITYGNTNKTYIYK